MGAGRQVTVKAVIDNLGTRPRGFVEAGGHVAIDAAHYSLAVGPWRVIPGLGRTSDGVTPLPVTAPRHTPGGGSPRLEYTTTLFTTGQVKVSVLLSPRNNVLPANGLTYAVSLDDQPPQRVNVTTATGANDTTMNRQWERNTSDNVNVTTTIHTVATPGVHVVKFWMLDPAVVLQRIVVDTGGVLPSYLGPPESRRV
ncbi:hypothetical protein [Nonomuraea sp. JJY05]|uniref:hypothetical protein n=1 Tax=Nonomuraea sp. JJY05 TaxID=3350255 RepID=UPI00373DF4DA